MWLAINRQLTGTPSADSGTSSMTRTWNQALGLPQNYRITFGPYPKRR
jgi:hypothetical protein